MRSIAPAFLIAALLVAGCGDDDAPSNAGTGQAPAQATTAPRPAPTEAALAAQRIRDAASAATDIGFMDAWMDPSQSALSRVVGPVLMLSARHAELIRTARVKFGEDGATEARVATIAVSVDMGNGLLEMFDADHFEEVRRDGGRAYVMANLADAQPIGDPIVFKDNQGDWLLLLCDGDKPWPEQRIAMFISTMGETLKHAGDRAKALDDIIAHIRSGEIESASQLKDAIQRMDSSRG